MTLDDLVARITAAAAGEQPLAAVAACLRALSGEREAVSEALSFLPGIGSDAEQAFYRAPELSLLKVVFAPGRRTPPHDHGTWAVILLLSGGELNTYWRERPGGGLEAVKTTETGPGSVSPMPEDAIHTVECAGAEPAVGLHVYGTDLITGPRRIWDPVTFEAFAHSEARYADLAKRASALPGPRN